jgi:CBS domain containing-hemolysin-like protein
MMPLANIQMAPSSATLADVRHILSVHYMPMILIYHRAAHNIVGVMAMRDLHRLDEQKKVIDSAKSPWFVTRDTSVLQLLQQFKRNNQSIAVILEPSGQAVGVLTLDQILSEIFGAESDDPVFEETAHYIERTLSGEISVSEFNQQFGCKLPEGSGDTVSDLILSKLSHLPVKGESIRINDLVFTIDEPSLRGIKAFSVRSIKE